MLDEKQDFSEHCEVLSLLLFVSGLAEVAIYYLRYCYHASLIGTVRHYAELAIGAQTYSWVGVNCGGEM